MKLNKLLVFSLFTGLLYAETSQKDLNKQAIDLLKAKKPQEAYELLRPQYGMEMSNDNLFVLGLSAKRAGKFQEAKEYFQALLDRDGSAMRVRLELASVQYRLGELLGAKKNASMVKASNPPKSVADNIEDFLQAIEAGIPKEWSYTASVGYMWDDNVNAGPTDDQISLYDSNNNVWTWTPGQAQLNNADKAMLLKGGIKHFYQHSDFYAWQSSFDLSVTEYGKINTYDSNSYTLSSGPTVKRGNLVYSLPFVANYLTIGHDQSYYKYSYGIAPQFNYKVSENLALSTNLGVGKHHYHKQLDRDSTTRNVALSGRYMLDQSSFVNVGLSHNQEEVGGINDYNSYDASGINLAYFRSWTKNIKMYLSPSYQIKRYHQEQTIYGPERRVDNAYTYLANVSYLIEEYDMDASLTYLYSDSKSNLEVYDYDRRQTMLMFTKRY